MKKQILISAIALVGLGLIGVGVVHLWHAVFPASISSTETDSTFDPATGLPYRRKALPKTTVGESISNVHLAPTINNLVRPLDNIQAAPTPGNIGPSLAQSSKLQGSKPDAPRSNILQSLRPGGIQATNITHDQIEDQLAAADDVKADAAHMYVRAIVADPTPKSQKVYIISDEAGLFSVDPSLPAGHQTQILGDANRIKYPMSLAIDTVGRIWVGTEGNGLYCYDPKVGDDSWQHFSTKDGLGDNYIYALAADKLGRIWAGHLNHGVSVYNEQSWQNYNVIQGLPREGVDDNGTQKSLAGPLGARIFAITTSPKDGDVWMATDAGLSRYSLSQNAWSYFTRAEGLPSDQIQALAFTGDGTLYAASQCDGIAVSSADLAFTAWRVICHNDALAKNADATFLNPIGLGLPTNLINALSVAPDDTLYIATTQGLAWSKDRCKTIHYIRGANYIAKLKGLNRNKAILDAAPKVKPSLRLLLTDYVSSISVSLSGELWLGYQQDFYEQLSALSSDQFAHNIVDLPSAIPQKPGFSTIGELTITSRPIGAQTLKQANAIASIIQVPRPMSLSSSDPSGHLTNLHMLANTSTFDSRRQTNASVELPTGAKLTSTKANQSSDRQMDLLTSANSAVMYLGDDWLTSGDWRGRYGRYWTCLCAMTGQNYIWGVQTQSIDYRSRLGIHQQDDDVLRYWIQTLYTSDHRCLEIPTTYLQSRISKGLTTPSINRRDASVDDHAEKYPREYDGPGIFYSLQIPDGTFVLSLYELNDNGHSGNNRDRDYKISIRKHSAASLSDIADFDQQPELARARVHDFYGGVYKRFLVSGPIKITVHIDKMYSFNTMLAGVFVDTLDEHLAPYPSKPDLLNNAGDNGEKTSLGTLNALSKANPYEWAIRCRASYANILRKSLETTPIVNVGSDFQESRIRETCFFRLGNYTEWENYQRHDLTLPSRDIELHLNEGRLLSDDASDLDLVNNYLWLHSSGG